MTPRQRLIKLGLNETQLRNIRYVKREMTESADEIQEAYISEEQEFGIPTLDYALVAERLEQRGLTGKQARQYTKKMLTETMQNLESIWETGHTSAYFSTYAPIADYYDMTVDQFKSYMYSEQVGMLKAALYELTGDYGDGSDVAELARVFNEALNANRDTE